jgi:hypothetical protein
MQHITEKIANSLQPQGRAAATAATFTLFFDETGYNEGQAKFVLNALSAPKDGDEPSVTALRKTCGEIAALIDATPEKHDIIDGFAKWVLFIKKCYKGTNNTDLRLYAMLETAERELKELFEVGHFV